MTNCSENTVSQIKNLKAELESIYDTKVQMKMHSMKTMKKIINSFSKQVSNTTLTIQFKNLN